MTKLKMNKKGTKAVKVETKLSGNRPGAGRPPLPEGRRREDRLIILVTRKEKDKVMKDAAKAGISYNTFVRQKLGIE